VKTIWMFGLLVLLLTVAYNKVSGAPSKAAQGADRSVIMPAPVAMAGEGSGVLPPELSEYVFLHQTRHESIPVHAMAGVKACPE